MEALLYLIKVNIAIALLYSLYRLLFQRDTFFRWKRFVLLSIVAVSFLYPLLSFSDGIVSPENIVNGNNFPVYYLNEIRIISGNAPSETAFLSGEKILQSTLALYSLVALFFLARIIVQVFAIVSLVRKTNSGLQGKIHVKKGLQTPFSFFAWIVLDPEKYSGNELKEILLHEETHVRQGHSLDMILSEIVCALAWFNPFAWLLKKEMRLNLEYLADHVVLNSGCEAEHYQFHLLRLSYTPAAAKITNNFNVSPLKKRIIMMNRKKTSFASIWKYTLLVPVFALLALFNQSLKAEIQTPVSVADSTVRENAEEKLVFSRVEDPPQFPGGDKALMKWLSENVKYPESAIKDSIQGRVVTRFIVNPDGKTESVEIMQSLNAACDAEAIRAIETMPAWTPGKQNGKAVYVYYTLPILYRLKWSDK